MHHLGAGLTPFYEPLTGFLVATNVVLGLFVLGCILLVVRTLFREIRLRRRARALALTSFGVTMADGGQRNGAEGHLTVAKNGTIQKENEHKVERPS